MNKITVSTAVLIIISAILLQSKVAATAQAASINFNNSTSVDDQSELFSRTQLQTQTQDRDQIREQAEEQNKERDQFRIKNHENKNGNQEFMVKGVISASDSGSLTIDNKIIKIDSGVTGTVKIVGNIQNGAYAMVKGEIINSTYYAEKIVVDQRNKMEIQENESPTATIGPSITPVATQSVSLGETDEGNLNNLNMNPLLEAIQNFINSVKSFMQSI